MVKTYNPFVESNLGYLEAELCKIFHVTPRGLGKLREEDPIGVEMMERHLIYVWNEKAKKQKEMEKKAKRAKSRGRRR